MDKVSDDDHLPARGPGCSEKLAHPRVVIRAIVDCDPRSREFACHGRTRFEEVRILIRVAEDARDLDVLAANLRRELAVEVLGRDDGNPLRALLNQSPWARVGKLSNSNATPNNQRMAELPLIDEIWKISKSV